jgi:hypothetical protein
VGSLLAYQRIGDAVNFPTAGPGVADAPGTPSIGVRNTGNVPSTNVTLKAQDLVGRTTPSVVLNASRFKAGASLGTAVQMQRNVSLPLGVSLPTQSNVSIGFWLSMPLSQLYQEYYSATPWEVGVQ